MWRTTSNALLRRTGFLALACAATVTLASGCHSSGSIGLAIFGVGLTLDLLTLPIRSIIGAQILNFINGVI